MTAGGLDAVTVRAEMAVLIDVGSAWVKAGVIARANDRWRLVAHAAQPTAWGASELRRTLLDQLRVAADRRLIATIDDLFADANRIECHTARRPARAAVVAVSRELSGSAIRRAAEAAGWQVTVVVTFDDGRSLAERLATLQAAEVDAWLIGGGFTGSRSPRALDAAALVASARRDGGGPVIWAGSADLADEVAELFEPGVVSRVSNPRPDARREEPDALRSRLAELLREIVADPDETRLASVAFPRAVGALAAASGLRIGGVDLGARAATRVLAEPDGSVASRVHARGGLAGAILAPGAAGRITRMAGEAGDEAAVADLIQILRARPDSLPQTVDELAGTQAAALVQLAAIMDESTFGPVDLIIGAGRTIAAAPHPAQAARLLLDGIRPIGVTQLAVDAAALLGPLGSLADDEIGEGIALLDQDLLVPLGTAVVCRGGEVGRPAMRVIVHRSGWPSLAPIEVRVGQLQVVALPRGAEAELTIELAAGVNLGLARRSPRIHAVATGGAVGLILDARGVPIGLPRRGDDRRAMLSAWRDQLEREAMPGSERVA